MAARQRQQEQAPTPPLAESPPTAPVDVAEPTAQDVAPYFIPVPDNSTQWPIDPTINVAVAVARVMADLPPISKNGTAPGAMGGFAFRRIEDITAVIQKLMAKHGVVIIPRAHDANVHSFQTTNSQGKLQDWSDTRVFYGYTVMGPDGSRVEGGTYGIGRDNFDKGSGKAATTAYKIMLLQTFCIGDANLDIDGHDPSGGEEGRVIGQGNPPDNNGQAPIDWVALGWTTNPTDVKGATAAFESRMKAVQEAGKKALSDEMWQELVETRKKVLGPKMPYSEAQVKIWEGMVDAAMPPLGEDDAAEALGGEVVDEPQAETTPPEPVPVNDDTEPF